MPVNVNACVNASGYRWTALRAVALRTWTPSCIPRVAVRKELRSNPIISRVLRTARHHRRASLAQGSRTHRPKHTNITPQSPCRRVLEAHRGFAIDLPLHFHRVLRRTCRTCVELVVELVVFYHRVVELVHLRKISFPNIYSI